MGNSVENLNTIFNRNGPNMLECFIRLDYKGLTGANTLRF